jgi:molybdopterin-synthase adenylyltransferase
MLTDFERQRYEWQMWTDGVGEAGQEKLKQSRVLISRCGGVGGLVAMELAAAGVGTLVIAHAGDLKPSDLNRQLLMSHEHLGKARIDSVRKRLHDLNPLISVEGIPQNISSANAEDLVSRVDLVIDCAPLFEERFALNDAAVRLGKPMIETAMFDADMQLSFFIPGKTPCLRCIYPEAPAYWKRQFPVFGAVSGTVACLAAYEAIKWITGIGELLANVMLHADLGTMRFRRLPLQRNPDCPLCGGLS